MNCPTGKQPFTQAQAQDKARRASRRYSTGFAAYHCPECGGPVEHEGGCVICRNCGFSKCG